MTAALLPIARAALAGPWTRAALATRLAAVPLHAAPNRDPEDLATRLLDLSPSPFFGPPEALARLLAELPRHHPPPEPPRTRWRAEVPRWETPAELAAALRLTPGELDWFADVRTWNRRADQPLRHYRHRWLGARPVEAPKPRLAELQRRLNRLLLNQLPVHEAAHGFRPGRSAATFAAPHAGAALVARFDLAGFFTSITAARLRAYFCHLGYPGNVAAALTGLLTTVTPAEVLRDAPPGAERHRLATPHLPQGAPSSPAIANALAARLDRRLAGLAERIGAAFTRYADDLAFSGDLPLDRLRDGVRRIATDEGFRLHPGKTRIAAAHQRQRLAGLVVNHRPAVPRADYDQLRAVLHNCARTGPAAQNHGGHPDFRAHLLGRIGWVAATHPVRAARLRALFDDIDWSGND
ncbi:reverse transcriptase family protein [Crossiella sp. CA-258035]|uniref:reverse transcriptase family protein n=1 Tax=Crossiella sp. CA-258035 TaxID=2981138 RepID=UPI0024BD02DC|nr:reverse transcriptase family protein [Crossiella sp. CA-258035]WHT18787.1 reverse transcriptase family protein [Crossiella sp. CA-258035]